MKKITLWIFAFLTSWQLSAQVGITQNFDSSTALPTGWTETGGKSISPLESCTGNSIRTNLYSFNVTGTLVTPNQVAASNGTNLTVAFDYKIEDWNSPNAASPGWGNFQVQYSLNNGGAWTTFFTVNDGNHVVSNTCATFSSVIPAASVPNGSDVKIRFLFTWVAGDYDVYIDNFSATQVTALPPACTVLSAPANGATNVLDSNITWNSAAGIPTGYKLKVGTTSGGTDVLNLFDAGNVTNYNLGALAPGTTYFVTVIPYNANGDATGCTESSFTTCGAISALPYLEPFATFLPGCWLFGDDGDLTAGPATFAANGWKFDGFANVGFTGSIAYNHYTTGANDWIVSPVISIPAIGYELKFDASLTQWNGTVAPTTPWDAGDVVEVLVSTTGLNNWTVIYTIDSVNAPAAAGSPIVVDLDAYASQNIRVAFRVVSGATDGGDDTDIFIDNFQVRLSPTCPDQTGLVVSGITSSGANTSWDDMSTGGSVGYEYAVTTSATPPASGTATASTFYIASGLLPQTVYYLHVRSECAGSTYGNWSTTTFTTACGSVTSFTQNFDAVTTPAFPTCWVKLGTTGLANTQTGSASSAPNTMYIYAGSGTDMSVVSMQPVSNMGSGTHRITFDMRANFTVGGVIEFGYLTNPADATTFVSLTNFTASSLTYSSFQFAPPAGVYSDYMAFRHIGVPANSVLIDNVVWQTLPLCPDQTGLVVSGITSSGANTSWDPVTTDVEYAVTTSLVPPASGTPTTATFYIASGLLPQTVYYLHVRTDCGGGVYGNWSTISFTTQCAPITTLPWNEGFEGLTTVGTTNFPPCWFKENGEWESQNTNGTYSTANTGTNYIRDPWFATNEFIWTPGFDLVAGTSYDFSSFVQGDNATGWVVDYFVNNAQNSTGATQVGASYTVPGTGTPYAFQPYAQVTRSFVPATTGTYYFAVRVNQPSFAPWYVSFDDFKLELSPACPTPSASAGNVTNASADLTWAAVPSATLGYEYVLDNVATDPAGAGTSTLVTTFAATGLTQLTTYYFHIRSVCSAGTYSAWSTVSFTTLATPPANDNLCNATPLTVGTPTGLTNTLVGATAQTSEPIGACFNGGINGSVWFSFVAPASGSAEVSTDFGGGTLGDSDTEIAVYAATGVTCANLTTLGTPLGCDQDGGTTANFSSFLSLTGLTPGDTYYVQVDRWGTVTPGTFGIQVTEVLSSNSFDTTSFVAYPNPVKDVLNLSYKTVISNVRIINLLGQEVLNTKANTNDVQVNMSALTAGAYIVNITVEDTVHTIKVIKQ